MTPLEEIGAVVNGTKSIEGLSYIYIYELNPIDWRWDAAKDITAISRESEAGAELAADWEMARDLLHKHSSWHGDGGEGATPILVPNLQQWCVIAWVVKQQKSGWTYVVSRMPLVWLDGEAETIIPLPTPDTLTAKPLPNPQQYPTN